MQQLRLIIHHLQRGLSGRKIARELGLSRNTVKLYGAGLRGCSNMTLTNTKSLMTQLYQRSAYPSLEKAAQDPRRSGFTNAYPRLFRR